MIELNANDSNNNNNINNINKNNNNSNNHNNGNNGNHNTNNNNKKKPILLISMFMIQQFFRWKINQRSKNQSHMLGGILVKSLTRRTKYCQAYALDSNENKVDNINNIEIDKSNKIWKSWKCNLIKMKHQIGHTLDNYQTYLPFPMINKSIKINNEENGLCMPHLMIQLILFSKYIMTSIDYLEYFDILCEIRGIQKKPSYEFNEKYYKFFNSTTQQFNEYCGGLWINLLKKTPKSINIKFTPIDFNEIIKKKNNIKKNQNQNQNQTKKKRKYSQIGNNNNNNNEFGKEPPKKKRKK